MQRDCLAPETNGSPAGSRPAVTDADGLPIKRGYMRDEVTLPFHLNPIYDKLGFAALKISKIGNELIWFLCLLTATWCGSSLPSFDALQVALRSGNKRNAGGPSDG